MANFGPLAAEIGLPVWGTPANFNGFRVLAALLHGIQVVSVSQNLRPLNRGRHLCSAGRPSRWALAYILVMINQLTVKPATWLKTIKRTQNSCYQVVSFVEQWALFDSKSRKERKLRKTWW